MYNEHPFRSNWWGFIGKRVLIAVVVFFVITLVVFCNIRLSHSEVYYYSYPYSCVLWVPGGPELMMKANGWDDPFIVKYVRWIGGIFTGDWGISLIRHIPVKDMLF
jgi:peptide/nickel transport system permease protein